jgi:transmembrane sensor
MTQHEFDILTDKYLAGNCSPEEIAMLARWSESHIETDDENVFRDEAQIEETEERLWRSIQADANIRKPAGSLLPKWLWTGIAACLAMGITYYFFHTAGPAQIGDLKIQGTETKNIANSRQNVVLPDGSIVTLEKNAKIITAAGYGRETRAVYLTGEAFFQIQRNTKVPFLVHSGDLVTEVLGTSFRIKPEKESKTIEVSVKTGRVSVYASAPGERRKFNGVIITPNQRVVYDTEHKTIRQDIVDVPEVLASGRMSHGFEFNEATIDQVLTTLTKAYGVEMMVANPVLNQCTFTGDISGLSMYNQLDFVCGVINARYEVRGTTVFITGTGCKSTE